jgi:hypothetical protein
MENFMKRSIAIALTVSALALVAGAPASAAPAQTERGAVSFDASQASDFSAKKKMKRMSHKRMHRHYRQSYGYDRGYYPGQGYYRGVQPGYGYGPDPGDRAWPPFHFKPYY